MNTNHKSVFQSVAASFLVLLSALWALSACASQETATQSDCPQPSQPECMDRTEAWCSSASKHYSEGALPDGATAVACPDTNGDSTSYAVFPGHTLDSSGVPEGCPNLLEMSGGSSVVDAGTQSGSKCCYPTFFQCFDLVKVTKSAGRRVQKNNDPLSCRGTTRRGLNGTSQKQPW